MTSDRAIYRSANAPIRQHGKAPPTHAAIRAARCLAAGDVRAERSANATVACRARNPSADTLVVAGGVAANRTLRRRLADLAAEHGMRLVAPPARLCTDNAVMIAWAGVERLGLGLTDGLDFAPRPRWPLDPDAPPAAAPAVTASSHRDASRRHIVLPHSVADPLQPPRPSSRT